MRKGKGTPISYGSTTQSWAARLVKICREIVVSTGGWLGATAFLAMGLRPTPLHHQLWGITSSTDCQQDRKIQQSFWYLEKVSFSDNLAVLSTTMTIPEILKCHHACLQSFQSVIERLLSKVVECKYLWGFIVWHCFFFLFLNYKFPHFLSSLSLAIGCGSLVSITQISLMTHLN